MTDQPDWQCVCGETDISKHDLGTAIAHIYGIPEEQGREIHLRVLDRLGLEPQTKKVSDE